MLFHTLDGAESGAYFDQLTFEVAGLRLDVFEAAWRELMARHAVLRTAVLWEGLPGAVQVVAREAPFAVERRDWSASLLDEDRRRGFALGPPPVVPVGVAQPGGGPP